MSFDVAIVGGGPAGLAAGIESARRGLSTVLFEREQLPKDKACGEGVMPAGLRALERMGVLERIRAADRRRFEGIRYVQEDATFAQARVPGGGLAIRRTALIDALRARAIELGVVVRERSAVRAQRRIDDGFALETDAGVERAAVLIGADGLASPLRRALGLDRPMENARRYGIRRHFAVEPWSDRVEIHLSPVGEAYVTPVGDRCVGVAVLFEKRSNAGPTSFDSLLSAFSHLRDRIERAEPISEIAGSGPFECAARRIVDNRFALVGDAAGYVDAITGEGLSLAFGCAEALGAVLPDVLARKGAVEAFAPYARAHAEAFRRYAFLTRAMLALARRPWLRRPVVRALGRVPRGFDWLVATALGERATAASGTREAARLPAGPLSPR